VKTELHTASAAGVDFYNFLIFADQLHIEHHSHAPGRERSIAVIHSLLCSVPAEDAWMTE
jgi:hypothetical protein